MSAGPRLLTGRASSDPAWMSRALCRGRWSIWLSDDPLMRQVAVRGCGFCPVRAECGSYADEMVRRNDPPAGVWAGRTWASR